jgi:hypothetical protein
MRASDFFEYRASSSTWPGSSGGTVFRADLLDQLGKGPIAEHSDLDVTAALVDLVDSELQAYGTGGGEQLTEAQLRDAITVLRRVSRRAGAPVELPFRDFTGWKTYWLRHEAYGSWQARRDLVEELLGPHRERLEELAAKSQPELAQEVLSNLRDAGAIQEHLTRIKRNISEDPAAAIGSAKELVESTAKTVLIELGLPVNKNDDVPALASQAQRALGLHPQSVAPGPDSSDAVRKILGAMVTVANSLGELRNHSGTGHGGSTKRIGLGVRHGHLAVNASITWCQLMLDTLTDPEAPWRNVSESA